jgi:HK97 family phage major capsid protein
MTLGGYTYVTTPVAASLALEQDSFVPVLDLLSQAFSVGLARGIGSDLVNGSGSGAPEGVLTAAADSGITSAGSTFTKAELQSIYFSVNRAYRISPKAAWLMHDDTYNAILALKDSTTNRPLVNITEDGEKLFGKRILISPDMPTEAGTRALIFGDLGQYCVRVVRGSASVKRNFQAAGYAEKALGLYTSFLRVDASLNAPNGAQPVVYGTLHA